MVGFFLFILSIVKDREYSGSISARLEFLVK